jgi:hypothetical protein
MNLFPFDPSKQPHPKTVELFTPFIPGIFFEMSLLLGGFEFKSTLPKAPSPYLEYYGQIALALFCAYFVGLTASIATSMLQYLIKATYFKTARAIPLTRRSFVTLCGRRRNTGSWVFRKVLLPLRNRWIRKDMAIDRDVTAAYRVWLQAADRLLQAKFGIDAPAGPEANKEWGFWHNILGSPTDRELRGSIFNGATHAAGWLGLVAAQITPALRNRYYFGLVAVLIITGLISDFSVARSWGNRVYDIMNRTRCVLRDIPIQGREMPNGEESEEQ